VTVFKKLDYYLLTVLLLTAWGFVLRIYALGDQSLWNDEASSISAAMAMLDHGIPLLPSGEVYSRAILNTGMIALSLNLFGDTEFAARLPSVLFGTLTIPLVFIFARKVTNDKAALIAAAATAFLMIEIGWSRQARMYQEFQFFYILSLYLFYRYTQTERKRDLVFATFATICAIMSHRFGLSLILIFMIYTLVHNTGNIRGIFSWEFLLSRKAIISILCVAAVLALLEGGLGVISSLWDEIGFDFNLHFYLKYLITAIPVILVLAVVGAIVLLRRDRRAPLFLTLSVIVPLYLLSFHFGMRGDRYVYFLLPNVFILFSFAVIWLSELLPQFRGKNVPTLLSAVMILGVVAYSSTFVFVPQSYYYHFDTSIQQPDFKGAYAFVEENRTEDNVVIDAWPVVGVFYLSASPDYCLISKYVDDSRGDELQEKFTGIPYIQDVGVLEDIVEDNETGWLVVDSYGWEMLSDETIAFITGNLTRYPGGSFEGERGDVMVYGWES
jgi:4-amino-4-deoxy-L-arabinose transferase-like glycosyltransferase